MMKRLDLVRLNSAPPALKFDVKVSGPLSPSHKNRRGSFEEMLQRPWPAARLVPCVMTGQGMWVLTYTGQATEGKVIDEEMMFL